jgi:hypothetical protein
MQRPWKAVLCCMCRMLVLMTSQCLCPVVISRYDSELKKKFMYSLHLSSCIFLFFYFLFLHQINTARWMMNKMSECIIYGNGKSRGRRNFMPEE